MEPVTSSDTEKIAEEIPGVFPSCVVTRVQAKKMAKEENSSLDTEDEIIDLSQTFMDSYEDSVSSRSFVVPCEVVVMIVRSQTLIFLCLGID